MKIDVPDFGLSRSLNDSDHYSSSTGILPVRWSAPESLMSRLFSSKSDVWSFGLYFNDIVLTH